MLIAYRSTMYLKYYLLLFLVFSFLLAGCSSKEAVKEKEVKKKVEREVVPPKKVLRTNILLFRHHIRHFHQPAGTIKISFNFLGKFDHAIDN